MKRVTENLKNQNEHYLYPFFWQHGESKEVLKEYIDKMLEQGIYNMCIESRPHPDFLEAGWWQTMDDLVDMAKANHMKIWILDDAKFPTGYANGKVPDELKKRYLAYRRFDIAASASQVEINLSQFVDMREVMKDQRHQQDQFFKAILVENDITNPTAFHEDTLKDVSDCYKNQTLSLHLEKKHYSLFIIYITLCGEEATQEYLDPMRQEATQILINEVYEKHYQHYKDEFQKTIVGFFSDEPRFGNIKGTTASIGRENMPLPWNQEVYQLLKQTYHFSDEKLLYLFVGECEQAYRLRFEYMNIVTQLYSQNFSQYIGVWCQEKGIHYVGHTIEDNNAHARLGYGTGHYFRGIAGQSMAGIDIIGGQVIPGMDYHHDAFSTGGSDGEFYHYALVKMGASAAKLDPRKNGTLMCEAFGAYGWIEGLKMMKWITDHMVSHGVNLIVPHAFDPAAFPDWDCPPHFYAHGNNPQYSYFHKWSTYADHLCHLLSGGFHDCEVGVLYHAFAEWSGNYMLMQKVLKELSSYQIGNDIISEDDLMNAVIENDHYIIHNYQYKVLVIPYAQRLPEDLLEKIQELSSHVRILFIDQLPDVHHLGKCEVIPLASIGPTLKHYQDVDVSSYQKHLVTYKYKQEDGIVYMFNNEDIHHCIDTEIVMKEENLMIYDAYKNQTYQLESQKRSKGLQFHLHLEPYQSLILVTGKSENRRYQKGHLISEINEANVSLKWYNENKYYMQTHRKIDDTLAQDYPYFSGHIKYEFDIDGEKQDILLELEEAYELIEVIVNGKSVETFIAPPYVCDLSAMIERGHNHIEIIATNNLSRNQRDSFSSYLALEPLGITKPIKLYQKEEY